jgi:hypothetical protein
MLLRLDDPRLVVDVCAHFRRSGFTAERAGGSMIEVSMPDAPTSHQAEQAIRMHLQVWQLMNPGQGVEPVP